MIYRKWFGSLASAAPTLISKINTVTQIVYVLVAMLAAIGAWSSTIVINALIYITAATTIISGADYIVTYSKRAAVIHRGRITAAKS